MIFEKRPIDNFTEYVEWKEPIPIDSRKLANAKIFGKRSDVFEILPQSCRFLEVGVLAGDFSQEVVAKLAPVTITLLDFFQSNDWPWILPPRFDHTSHLKFIEETFSRETGLEIIQGDSRIELPKLLGREFDFIYIDANHSYEGVSQDLLLTSQMCAPGGIIGLNDYIMHDYKTNREYGIVQAVNEFLFENENWVVGAYALNPHMFSDIFLKRTY